MRTPRTASFPTITVANGEVLPVDLDGDPYRWTETLGLWKVTRCCGAFATGCIDLGGIACKGCYEEVFEDGPARLDDDDEVGIARAKVAALITVANGGVALAAEQEHQLEDEGLVANDGAPYSTVTPLGEKLLEQADAVTTATVFDNAVGAATHHGDAMDTLESALADGADITALLAAQAERHGA